MMKQREAKMDDRKMNKKDAEKRPEDGKHSSSLQVFLCRNQNQYQGTHLSRNGSCCQAEPFKWTLTLRWSFRVEDVKHFSLVDHSQLFSSIFSSSANSKS
ncbi:hypothetical protein ILYODFUR_034644 [Ilyodon furcidens]|uniref:Uncharacterized protein n=1 Tax=Ilyodon furcidens TaxID=33524 RepID=A0ABV0UCS8_9TELE